MRLDHLLSRERTEAGRLRFKPRSIRTEMSEGQAGETAGRSGDAPKKKKKRKKKSGKKVGKAFDPVSFS